MTIATAIARFRARQAEQFTDSGTVYRQVGELTTDPDTGAVTRTFAAVYVGPCKIRPAERSGSDLTTGETEVRLIDVAGKFPVDTDLRLNDVLVMDDSAYDTTMAGRQYRITEANADAWQIAKVVGLEETLVPELTEGS